MSVPFSKLDKFKMETVFHDGYVVNTTIGWDLSTTKAVLTTWTRQKKLGSGGFGTVWLEKNEEGGQLRAVKKLQRVDVAQMAFTNELVALITLADHRHLFVEFFGWYENETDIFFAMEYLEYGDLNQYIKRGGFTITDAQEITAQVLEALVVLHTEGICHRDLKPQNVLMASYDPLWVKIADFGTSKRLAHTALRTMVGTPGYLAPELLRLVPRTGHLEEFTYALDIWSMGCLVHELLTSQTPFCEIVDDGELWDESGFTVTGSQTDMGLLYQYCQGTSAFPTEVLESAQVPQEGIDFVKELLVADPRKRLQAVDAQRSTWLKDIGYRSPWFTDMQRECNTLGLYLDTTDKTLVRRLRTDDIALHLRNLPPGKRRLTGLLERALGERCYLVSAMLANSRTRLLEDPFGVEVMRLFTRGVEEGKVNWTRVLLGCVVDVNSTFADGRTGLQTAVMMGHSVVAKLFLQRGADIEFGSIRTVLQIAAENRDPEMVEVLLQSTNSTFSTKHVLTALEIAVKTGCLRIVEALLAYESLVNAVVNNQTLLQIAVESQQAEIVQLLLQQKDADPTANPSNIHGQTALEMAARNGSLEILKLLLKHETGSTLAGRVRGGFFDEVKKEYSTKLKRFLRGQYRGGSGDTTRISSVAGLFS